jgi:hypothetical protein
MLFSFYFCSAAQADWYEISGPNKSRLKVCVVDGELRLAEGLPFECDWDLTLLAKKRPTTIHLSGETSSKIKYLTFNLKGKCPKVFLSAKPGPGTQWRLTHGKGAASYTIRAANGKFKGWYLNIWTKAEKLEDRSGKTYHAYKLTLSKQPKRTPIFSIYVIAK